jgi:hypothetical protein
MYNKTALFFVLFFLVILFFFILYKSFFYENYTSNDKYTAVIIEPREHKALSFVLKNLFLAFPDATKQFFSPNFCYLLVLYEH